MISEELEARIDRALGFPTHDPHGDPIPDANLEWPAARLASGRRRSFSSGASSSSRRNGWTFSVAPSLLGDDRVVLERRVGRVETVVELVPSQT